MGIDRRRRSRGGQRSSKFTQYHINSEKHEGRTLDDYLAGDLQRSVDLDDTYLSFDDLISVEEYVLYEMGILYDTQDEKELPLPEVVAMDADWDVVSEVSELEWEVVSLDGQFTDDESWG